MITINFSVEFKTEHFSSLSKFICGCTNDLLLLVLIESIAVLLTIHKIAILISIF
jgi:hypothetical protein